MGVLPILMGKICNGGFEDLDDIFGMQLHEFVDVSAPSYSGGVLEDLLVHEYSPQEVEWWDSPDRVSRIGEDFPLVGQSNILDAEEGFDLPVADSILCRKDRQQRLVVGVDQDDGLDDLLHIDLSSGLVDSLDRLVKFYEPMPDSA